MNSFGLFVFWVVMLALEIGLIVALVLLFKRRERFRPWPRGILLTLLFAVLLSPAGIGGHGLAIVPFTYLLLAGLFCIPQIPKLISESNGTDWAFLFGPFFVVWAVTAVIYFATVAISALVRSWRESSSEDF